MFRILKSRDARLRRRLAVLVLVGPLACGLWPTPLSAAIEFEQTELSLQPSRPGEKKLTAEFRFKNTGAEPVAFTQIYSGCSCTVPTTPREPVAPGESGVLPVIYSAGERQGRQMQSIQVETSDGRQTALRLVVDLPTRITFAPRLLLFSQGDRATREATLTYGDDTPVTLLEVRAQSGDFEVIAPQSLDGPMLKLSLRYIGAANAEARGTVAIRTRGLSGAEYTDLLYVRHRP